MKVDSYLHNRHITVEVNREELARIPKGQPVVLVTNRLLEGVDELILLHLAEEAGVPLLILSPDNYVPQEFRNRIHPGVSMIRETNRPFDYFQHLASQLEKVRLDQEAIGLAINFSGNRIREFRMSRGMSRLMRCLLQFEAPIVPIRLQSTELAPPVIRRGVRLLQKLWQQPMHVTVRIGNPIQPEDQKKFQTTDQFRRFLRTKIYALGTNLEVKRFFFNPFRLRKGEQEPIAAPIDPDIIEDEIKKLTYRNFIASQGEFDVIVASALEIPQTLFEIGRLRELTFRGVGEGTGKSRDMDEYDLYYHQLLIWDRVRKKIVGGYRMGKGDEIFATLGVDGFYISSLFRIQPGFFPIMKESVELGRSYVVPEYQRKRLPLFLLWKGILFFLLQNPQYRYLYGPLSISKHYSKISRSLIVEFIKRYYFDHRLASFLKPRKPFKVKHEKVDLDLLLKSTDNELKALDNLIEDIEPDHFRMPVLMRQYVKLNARFISFNVDPQFSDVLDGFIILDLQDVPISMIESLKGETQ